MDRKRQIEFAERAEERHAANFERVRKLPAFKAALGKFDHKAAKKPTG